MPTTHAHVKKLVDRLVTLPSGQGGMFETVEDERKAVRTELGKALERYARSDADATTIVDRLMEGKFRPTPGEMKAVADALPAQRQAARLPEPCETCQRSDFVEVERNGVSAAGRCACARGQRLAAADKLRAEELERLHGERRL